MNKQFLENKYANGNKSIKRCSAFLEIGVYIKKKPHQQNGEMLVTVKLTTLEKQFNNC